MPNITIHQNIVKSIQSLGYELSSEGCCRGISTKWLEACLLNEEIKFLQRISRIIDKGESLAQAIHAVKEKQKGDRTDDDKALLEIVAFYDSLMLFHNPSLFSSVFNKSLNQEDITEVSLHAASDRMIELGGLTDIYSEIAFCTQEEIKVYLDELDVVLRNSDHTVAIMIASVNHAIALTYTTGVGWRLMDINQYPPISFTLADTLNLAACIAKAFQLTGSKGLNFTFATTIIMPSDNNSLSLKQQLDTFKEGHSFSKVKINSPEISKLTFIAALNGDIRLIGDLAQSKVDLNKLGDRDGATPAYAAAQNGHYQVIALLLKYDADLSIPASHGGTPAYIAAQEGYHLVIREIGKIVPSLLNETVKVGTRWLSPTYIAAEKGHAAVIRELAFYGANINVKIGGGGVTPLFIAAQLGHTEAVRALLQCQADATLAFTTTKKALLNFSKNYTSEVKVRMREFIDKKVSKIHASSIPVSPADIAYIMGHTDIISLFDSLKSIQETTKYANKLVFFYYDDLVTPPFLTEAKSRGLGGIVNQTFESAKK